MKPAYQTVIFDIDGTLLKSDRGVMNALKYTTEKMGVPYPSAEIRQKFIGPPLHYNFHDLMGMNEADTARAIDLFNEYYLPIGVFESELYPGIMELVTGLFDQRARVCIATAKSKPMADRVVAHFGLTPYLACMETKADEQPTGDKKVLIRQILEDTGAKPEEAVMVGDTCFDAEGAFQNRMPFIGVTYGYGLKRKWSRQASPCLLPQQRSFGRCWGSDGNQTTRAARKICAALALEGELWNYFTVLLFFIPIRQSA